MKRLIVCTSLFTALTCASHADDSMDIQAAIRQLNDVEKSLTSTAVKMQTVEKSIEHDSALQTIYLNKSEEVRRALDCLNDKVIYGDDSRANYYCGTAEEKRAVEGTAAFMMASKLSPDSDPSYIAVEQTPSRLCTKEQTASLGLPPESFYDEPETAFCSGFKVGEKLIATAGHCIPDESFCANTKIVFGFYRSDAETEPTRIPVGNVYQCKKIVAGNYAPDTLEADWRVIEVDRPIEGRPSFLIQDRSPGAVTKNQSVTVIGYPIGMPAKITRNASVIAVEENYFVADSDTYGGNSGSVVVDADKLAKGELVAKGIVVRGARDFIRKSPCYASNRCQKVELGNGQCGGESSTHAWLIKNAIGN
ncbi:serine protease [Mesorhizobium sp. WSM3879]|uniref:trypsin-like serine peptidase n=1 Tax=Mesorhizobium sp. WSM3879 TaxID=2029406 RepID=UPI0011806F1C|nr:serine protease [Mesorhizobium sp. WSM3879]